MKLLEHAMKIVERVLEKRLRTLDAIFIEKNAEEYQKKDKKLYLCLAHMEKAFDRVPRKVME